MRKKLANLLNKSSCYKFLKDEKYSTIYTYDGSNMQGNDSNAARMTNLNVQVALLALLEKTSISTKVMTWVTISMSVFRSSKSETVNSDIQMRMIR